MDILFKPLITATIIVILNVFLHISFIAIAEMKHRNLINFFNSRVTYLSTSLIDFLFLIYLCLWLMLAHVLEIWLWALLFSMINLFENFETSLYFSTISYTTVGFGDVVIGPPWRILSGSCAFCGLTMFGITTAYLFKKFILVLAKD